MNPSLAVSPPALRCADKQHADAASIESKTTAAAAQFSFCISSTKVRPEARGSAQAAGRLRASLRKRLALFCCPAQHEIACSGGN